MPTGVSRKQRQQVDNEWRDAIGRRVRELRRNADLSLEEVVTATNGLMSKSQISNYEQGLRLPGPAEAVLLAKALHSSPAHILCLDNDVPVLSPDEVKLLRSFRALPENIRNEYVERIVALALAFKKPVADELIRRRANERKKQRDLIERPKPLAR
jgi:transcriptional regulator with XRE-family HTH domain